MRFDWKDAMTQGNREKMQSVLDSLHDHVGRHLESLGIDREALEMEGLGLRPLAATSSASAKITNPLARRFYRLAQWTEILQGDFWLTDPDSEVYRYYSLAYKLDNIWWAYCITYTYVRYNGSYSLAQAAMNVFETNGHSRHDSLAVNSYGTLWLDVSHYSRACHQGSFSKCQISRNAREND